MVGSSDLSGEGDCLVYAIRLRDGSACLIDVGTENITNILQNIKETTIRDGTVSYLILTHAHYDHAGGAHLLKLKIPDLEIIAHEFDLPALQGAPGTESITAASWYGASYVPVEIKNIIRNDGKTLTLGGTEINIIHTPRHKMGSLSILMEDDGKKVLFGQDIHGPFMDEFKSNIHSWANSMKKLISLEPDILCEGHFGVYKPKSQAIAFITNHLARNGF